jgi:hypothetical protein
MVPASEQRGEIVAADPCTPQEHRCGHDRRRWPRGAAQPHRDAAQQRNQDGELGDTEQSGDDTRPSRNTPAAGEAQCQPDVQRRDQSSQGVRLWHGVGKKHSASTQSKPRWDRGRPARSL